eukprot:gene2328-1463_t
MSTPICPPTTTSKLEVVAAHVALLTDDSSSFFTVATVYYPPYRADTNVPDDPSSLPTLFATLQEARVDVIAGDFNAWHPTWATSSSPSADTVSRGTTLYNLLLHTACGMLSSSLPELRAFNTLQFQRTPPPDYDLYTDGSVKPLEASSSAYILIRPPLLDNWPAVTPRNASPSLQGSGPLLLGCLRHIPAAFASSPTRSRYLLNSPAASCTNASPRWRRFGAFYPRHPWYAWTLSLSSPTLWRRTLTPLPSTSPDHYHNAVDRLAAQSLSPEASPPHSPLATGSVPVLSTRRATFQTQVTGSTSPFPLRTIRTWRTTQLLQLTLITGACRLLPGWRNRHPERCPWCSQLLGRRTVSRTRLEVTFVIPHIGSCPNFPEAQAFQLPRMFSPHPEHELRLVRLFAEALLGPITVMYQTDHAFPVAVVCMPPVSPFYRL